MYGTYPSLKPEDLTQGDLEPNYDFRGFYSTLAEKWLGLDPVPIVGGTLRANVLCVALKSQIRLRESGYADHRRRGPGI